MFIFVAPSLLVPLSRRAFAAALAFSLLGSAALPAEEERSGEQIYQAQCASCHGARGEGVDKHYPNPLIGDRSLKELVEYVDQTMPENDPKKCVGKDAEKVSAYIFDAFYSPVAQARNKPARIELSRLTVRQYRNATADLIGTFRSEGKWDDKRGLRGDYFKGRRFNDRVLERVDPTIAFDFGEAGPNEKFEPHQFSIRWEGSVLAPDTGDYDFVVRTDHSLRLWVNDLKQPLVDAYVKSGADTEFRGTLRLLGGRAYPLKLEFSKANQGVEKKDEKPKPVKSFISLSWKPPRQVEQIIPARNLSPNRFPETYVVTAAFPPDDRSVGYERGTTISKAWEEATTAAAIETAAYVADHLRELSGVAEDAGDRKDKLRQFCYRLVERAFRRPLTDELKTLFVDRHLDDTADLNLAVKRVVLLTLKSPRFLYREVGGPEDAYAVASRISFGLWDSLPDKELLAAAAAGKPATGDEVRRQAERMFDNLRTRAKLRDFFLQWLKVDQVPDLAKDRERFADFDEAIATDLRTSLELSVEDAVWGETSDFRSLLTADSIYLNGRLAKFYGAELPGDAPFQRVPLDAGRRAGLLSHPYLLAGFAYSAASSPIHRGVFVSRSILGRALRPPPEAVAPIPAELHASLTTRERVELQTKSQACLSCHGMINPLGFPLEHFDAVGRYRTEESARPIDATGGYFTRSGEKVKFNGAPELAAFLASSDETHTAFTQQLFQYLVKQPVRAFGGETLPKLRQSFTDNHFHIRKLAVEIIAASAVEPPTKTPTDSGATP